jgi:hypothetical protein
MNSLIQQKKTTPAILVVLACFGLSPMAQALLPPPPPDGGYPGQNTAEGDGALFFLTTGDDNTAIGYNALHSNTGGDDNTAVGSGALFFNQTGNDNTAIGLVALGSNTNGNSNTATGANALNNNTTGDNNTATGSAALASNTTGTFNTANGVSALFANTTGGFNTAIGNSTLNGNTTGRFNTATGGIALASNTIGSNNTASGYSALAINSIGLNNTAVGYGALLRNTRGGNNIGLGFNAGSNLNTGSNNIDIGNAGVAAEANTIRIGVQGSHTRTFVAGISGSPITGTSVVVNNFGRLGTAASSQRFKEDIKPMDKASEALLALKPVTFHYKKEVDPEGVPQVGLVAEEVEKVNPDLVTRDDKGEIYAVRYEMVNSMLLNEFLKEHRKVEGQQAAITELKSTVAQQQKKFQAIVARQQEQIEALTAGLLKVSAQLEASKPALQVVNNR